MMNAELEYAMLTPADYVVIQQQIEERARATASNEYNYQLLLNDNKFRSAVVREFIMVKKRFLQQTCNPSLFVNQDTDKMDPMDKSKTSSEYEGTRRDEIAAEYGVVMSQFQTRFRDTTADNLKNSNRSERLSIYHDRIGYLGMKTFDVTNIPQGCLLEALFLYVLDDIEEKQRGYRGLAGAQFLERVGMDGDISSYYKAHRKSNHGGASSALYAFNEGECFSFRRDCMRSGLKTDVDAMDEADNRKAKNHPYQRSFYGHPTSQKENRRQQN
jgi:hypothetical protein